MAPRRRKSRGAPPDAALGHPWAPPTGSSSARRRDRIMPSSARVR
ncbi:hypothetical protein CZ774_13965 [Frigoribacterium sp. JB110]|nr:hypothetical protein CZ774_13965 [Frigoribacterium sp. JB110]